MCHIFKNILKNIYDANGQFKKTFSNIYSFIGMLCIFLKLSFKH